MVARCSDHTVGFAVRESVVGLDDVIGYPREVIVLIVMVDHGCDAIVYVVVAMLFSSRVHVHVTHTNEESEKNEQHEHLGEYV